MKAPTADYSPIRQAIKANINAKQASIASQDASNWKSRFSIQEQSIDLQKEAVDDQRNQNYWSTGLQVVSQLNDFASKLYSMKQSADQQQLPGMSSQYQSDLSKKADEFELQGKSIWEVGQEGIKYNAEFQSYADTHFDEVFDKKKLSTVSQKALSSYKSQAMSAIQKSTLPLFMQKQAQTIESNYNTNISEAQKLYYSSPESVGVSTFQFDDGMGGTTEYQLPSNMVSIINARADLDEDEKRIAITELSKQTKSGKVVYDSQSVYNTTGDYDQAKRVLDEGLALGSIEQSDYDTELYSLQSRNARAEYDPNQTQLNAGIKMYQKNGDIGYLEKWYINAYPDLASNPVKLQNLITQVQAYADNDTNRKLSLAKTDISKAVERGDVEGAKKIAEKVPGYSIELNAYLNNLSEMKDNQELIGIEKDLEQFAMNSPKGAEGALEKLDDMKSKGEITPAQYSSLKATLTSWSDASHVVSKTQQQQKTARLSAETTETTRLLDKAITGSEQDALKYIQSLNGRDPSLHGGKESLSADNTTQTYNMWYQRAEYQAGEILRTQGKEAAKQYIENESHLLTQDKKNLVDDLDTKSNSMATKASTMASDNQNVVALKNQLTSGNLTVSGMVGEILKNQPIIDSEADALPSEYQYNYRSKAEQTVSDAFDIGYAKIYAQAVNSETAETDIPNLLNELDSISRTAPSYMTASIVSKKQALVSLLNGMQESLGSVNTAEKMSVVKTLSQQIINGDITVDTATNTLKAMYNVTDISQIYENPANATTAITQANASLQKMLQGLDPDWKSDPFVADIIGNNFLSVLYPDGNITLSNLKDDPQKLGLYYIASEEYKDMISGYVVRYELDGKEHNGSHPNYSSAELKKDCDDARDRFFIGWAKMQEADLDEGDSMKVARKIVSGASEYNADESPKVHVSGNVSEKGYVPFTPENISFPDDATRLKWNDAVSKIGAELNANGYDIASLYTDKNGNKSYIPQGISADGTKLFYALNGGRSEVLVFDTTDNSKHYMDYDLSILTESQFKEKVGSESLKNVGYVEDWEKSVTEQTGLGTTIKSDGSLSYDNGAPVIGPEVVAERENQIKALSDDISNSNDVSSALDSVYSMYQVLTPAEINKKLVEVIDRHATDTPESKELSNKSGRLYQNSITDIYKEFSDAKTYEDKLAVVLKYAKGMRNADKQNFLKRLNNERTSKGDR